MLDNIISAVFGAAVKVIALIFTAILVISVLRAGLFVVRGAATFFFLFFGFVFFARVFNSFSNKEEEKKEDTRIVVQRRR